MNNRPKRLKNKKEPVPTEIDEIDVLAALTACTIHDYLAGVSAYVRQGGRTKTDQFSCR
jgi:hypothetical protein